jgi:16S rRNA (uracil1498-N3)-methyltransferase
MNANLPTLRLFIDQPLMQGTTIQLVGEAAHYLANVMRRRIGDKIELFNGLDNSFIADIIEVNKKRVTAMLISVARQRVLPPDIWLLFAPIKRTRLDFMAQKATELGARQIAPVDTDFCQVKRVKTDRLRANAIEAAEQTGRLDIPEIGAFESLEERLKNWPEDRIILFCDETLASADEKPDILANLKNIKGRKAALLIGPEGGFSENERTRILRCPEVIQMSLGPRILRSDTAALAALSLYQAVCGDWHHSN